jgi:hypothetical protein
MQNILEMYTIKIICNLPYASTYWALSHTFAQQTQQFLILPRNVRELLGDEGVNGKKVGEIEGFHI